MRPVSTPDTSFNGTGRRTYSFGSAEERATALFIQADGKIVICGYVNFTTAGGDDMLIMRLTANGTLDGTFNFSGSFDRAYGVRPALGGGYCVGGSRNNGFRWDFALARITAGGALDTTFDGDGRVTVGATSNANEAFALAVQSAGKILLAGAGNEGSNVWPVVRLTTVGALDSTFGSGVRTQNLGANFSVTALLLSADDRPLIIGNTSTNDVRVLRYTTSGIPDTSFATTGSVTIDYGSLSDRAFGGVVQSDTKILVVGHANSQLAMTRLIPDGTFDVKLAATLTLSGLEQEYTGSARVVTAVTDPAGLPVTVTYNGGATPPVAIGEYTVVGTVNSPLYQGSATGTLVVSRIAQTITFAVPGDRAFGSAPFSVAPTASSGLPVDVAVLSGPATLANKVVTLTGAGLVTLRATQPGNAVYLPAPDVDVSFEVVSSFASWIGGYNVGAAAGPADDPDADGLPNLVEYALGGLPDSAANAPAPVLAVSGGLLRLAYPRARADVTYTVETTTSLVPAAWTSAGVIQDAVTPVGQTATATIPLDSENAPRRFLRLRVAL